jgi:hypothetical protein
MWPLFFHLMVQEPFCDGFVQIADFAARALERLAEHNDHSDLLMNRTWRKALFVNKSNVRLDIWRQRPDGRVLDDLGWNMFGIHPLTVAA